ncbi:MAG TPA: YDG domain-containing protein, partial [Verrucomicrobiae bacterium]
SGEDVGLETNNAVGSFADKIVGTEKTVTVSGLALVGADIAHYSLTAPTTNADITPRSLTVTATGQNKVYDGTTAATVSLADDRVAGDVLTLSADPALFADKNVGAAKPVAVTGITVTGADAVNYTFNTTAATTADIAPATLTVTGIAAASKVYDANSVALITGTPTLAGAAAGDSVSLAGSPVGAFANRNVGTAIPVAVSGLLLSGADALNYSFVEPVLSANITAAVLTVTGLTAQDKTYDGTTVATLAGTPALAGVFGTDNASLVGIPSAAFATKVVGAGKPVSVTGLSLAGADAANYTLTEPALEAAITPAGLAVTGLSAQDKVYDGTTAATLAGTPALAGVISPDEVSLTGTAVGAFATKTAAPGKTVAVTGLALAGADAGNYTLAEPSLTAGISARPLAVTAAGVNKIYDGTTAATVTLSDDRLSGDILSTSYAAAEFADKNVATAIGVSVTGIALAGADAANYAANPTAATAADITRAALTVTANNATRVYSAPTEPAFTATFSGLVAGETPSVITGTPEFATTATASSPAGDYPITVSLGTLTAANYSFSQFVAGTLTITAASVTAELVSSGNPSWRDSNVTFTATLTVVSPATETPAGDVVFLANGVAFSTNALVAGVASATTADLPAGTNEVKVEYAATANFSATTATLQQVVNVPITYSQTNAVLAIEDKRDGTFKLTFQGTPQAQYYVISHTIPVAPTTEWTIIPGSTNTVTESSGLWNYTVTGDGPYRFYRSVAVNPAP